MDNRTPFLGRTECWNTEGYESEQPNSGSVKSYMSATERINTRMIVNEENDDADNNKTLQVKEQFSRSDVHTAAHVLEQAHFTAMVRQQFARHDKLQSDRFAAANSHHSELSEWLH